MTDATTTATTTGVRPVRGALPPLDEFLTRHSAEIDARLRAWCASRRLPTGLADDDVVQEALARVSANYPTLYDEQAGVPYAIAAGVRFVIDHHRAEQSRAHRGWRSVVALRFTRTASAEDDALAAMDRQRLRDALPRLAANERLAVELRYAENLPRAEVAALMAMSDTAVKGVLQRALRKLRADLGDAPALTPLAWLGRCRRPLAVLLTPRLLVAVFALAVTVRPAMLPAPHREAYTGGVTSTTADLPDHRAATRAASERKAGTPLTGRPPAVLAPLPPPTNVPGGKQPPVKAGIGLNDDRVGWVGGDEVCVSTGTGQEPGRPCANQNVVGLCVLLGRLGLLIDPYTTCERHYTPAVEPPPLP